MKRTQVHRVLAVALRLLVVMGILFGFGSPEAFGEDPPNPRDSCSQSGTLGNCTPNNTCSKPGSNPYGYPCQCTWFAWEKASQAGHKLPIFGNACAWDDGARNCGYTVSNTPAVGSIAVWEEYRAGALEN